jgi:Tol biopolymer transport system component
VTIRLTFLLAIILSLSAFTFGQAESVIAQLSDTAAESFAGGMSGNGRFVVFESTGNVATENPRNEDGNTEIFLFDYAQRRIFQLTDTKSVLFNPAAAATFNNVRVSILNTRPVISSDGKWIAFSSNATTSRPNAANSTNPGFFYGDSFSASTPTPTPTPAPTPIGPTPTPSPTPSPSPSPSGSPTPTPVPAANPLTADGNLEMWLYQIPAYADVPNLALGDEVPFTNLAGGTFIRVTNTDPSQLPKAATATAGAFVADDNHDASISDDGGVIAFVSLRNLVPSVGNAGPQDTPAANEDNDEIFTYVRTTATLGQVTKTPRGPVSNPIYNKNPTISGNGQRVAFTSTAENPIVGMTGGNNPLASRNEEIYLAELVAGSPTGATLKRQVTTTTSTNPGDPVNILDLGRRMSRDGRYIAFDSYADLANENSNANYTSFALYLYDATNNSFRRIGARSNADDGASGGDVAHYPGFTDYDANGTPATLVLETRLNINAAGSVPASVSDGLNDNPVRPSQVYSYPLNVAATAATFTRLARFPTPQNFIASTQLLPSNSLQRMAFNISLTEFGTGNDDLQAEVYYLLKPTATSTPTVTTNFFTGASRLPILPTSTPSPTPTPNGTPSPTPTRTPTPTPTPSPAASPSPSPSGTASPTPTPVTPAAVLGLSRGMLAIVEYTAGDAPAAAATAVGAINRVPSLPIELRGVSISINGAAAGIKSINGRRIEFVVPVGIQGAVEGTIYPITIFNNGAVMKSFLTIVPTRPDIFTRDGAVGPGGRAKAFNATNTILTTEPFVIKTVRRKGGLLVPSVIRLYVTGVEGFASNLLSVRLRDVTTPITGTAVLVEPGVYTIDFPIPASLFRAGDVPVVVTVSDGTTTFTSRLDDTAPKLGVL